jgi:hypothetical protein
VPNLTWRHSAAHTFIHTRTMVPRWESNPWKRAGERISYNSGTIVCEMADCFYETFRFKRPKILLGWSRRRNSPCIGRSTGFGGLPSWLASQLLSSNPCPVGSIITSTP